MMPDTVLNKKGGIVLSFFVVIMVILVMVFFGRKNQDVSVATTTDTSSTSQTVPISTDEDSSLSDDRSGTEVVSTTTSKSVASVSKSTSATYKNGTYSATGSYMSPGGQDQIAVTLTLSNDVITSVSVTPEAGDRTSSRYQSRFISGYQTYVVGKDISGLSLGKVSGASLTPIGFNDALNQIRAQAKS